MADMEVDRAQAKLNAAQDHRLPSPPSDAVIVPRGEWNDLPCKQLLEAVAHANTANWTGELDWFKLGGRAAGKQVEGNHGRVPRQHCAEMPRPTGAGHQRLVGRRTQESILPRRRAVPGHTAHRRRRGAGD
eukprot:1353623-Prymnesium_polylepis.1